MTIIFWLSIFIIFYTFLGYPILLFSLVKVKRAARGKQSISTTPLSDNPSCTLVVAAYNEEKYIEDKIKNSLALNYHPGKIEYVFITDGSTDSTPDIIRRYPEIRLMHRPQREGKIAAIHRAVETVSTDVIVFTDANTILNKDALLYICRHYADQNIGAVAGEKRVHFDERADASAAGEGIYWRYESTLKKWDSELSSVIGAAGELFSIRRELYSPLRPDTILDDFMLSMTVAKKGFRIAYEPEAYAVETASENIKEELKRKIRIAAGGIQSIVQLRPLLNIFRYGLLTFQYVSHRLLRWTVTPLLLILTFIVNIMIILKGSGYIYHFIFFCQVLFYLFALVGYLLEQRQLRVKVLFVPYYFCIMNYAVLAGMVRYFTGQQTAIWEKAQRK